MKYSKLMFPIVTILLMATGLTHGIPPWYYTPVAPANLSETIEGEDSTSVPFASFGFPNFEDCESARYQQIISADDFKEISIDTGYIWSMMLRGDSCNTEATELNNFVIRLSTTQRQPDHLSKTFNENVGEDQLEVFRTAIAGLQGGGTGCSGVPVPFDGRNWYVFSNVFAFSPLKGNLLVEFEYSGKRFFGARGITMDAQTVQGDGISRVYGCPKDASTAQIADTTGLVFMFLVVRPELTIIEEQTAIAIEWSYRLPWFRLQFSEGLAAGAVWKDYIGPIEESDLTFRRAKIEKANIGKVRYFRLYSESIYPSTAR